MPCPGGTPAAPGNPARRGTISQVTTTLAAVQHLRDLARLRRVRVIRDYGMFDRREAPQYYPAVSRTSIKL